MRYRNGNNAPMASANSVTLGSGGRGVFGSVVALS
jgi:hypothetical protein